MPDLIRWTNRGLFCEFGDFYIDPWRPVDHAIITHGHSDHSRPGSARYLCSDHSLPLLHARLPEDASIESVPYGEEVNRNGVRISFHPAGHILGSSQVRVEKDGEVWVVSGDYKTESDPTCADFEPIRCHVFITESTFALPVYRWEDSNKVFDSINDWWRTNREKGKTSVLFAYALGKAQRVLAGVDPTIGPILLHGAVHRFYELYRDQGVALPECGYASPENSKSNQGKALVVAPPSAFGTPWMKKFGRVSTAFASGWMQIRGNRRRRGIDRGFVVSDHADWKGLLEAVDQTGAERIGVTHGFSETLVRYLREQGKDAFPIRTEYEPEGEDT